MNEYEARVDRAARKLMSDDSLTFADSESQFARDVSVRIVRIMLTHQEG